MNAAFFDAVRATLFDGKLAQHQVDVLNHILSAWEKYGDGDPRKLAYILATAFHETGRFRWLREIWGPTAAQKRYEGRADLGNSQPGDGQRFMGRGLVHITGRQNYADWSKRLGIDLVGNPALAERLDIAARILVQGMMLGTFTGRKLADYITPARADYVEARRVVNGTDRSVMIAGYAAKFEQALKKAAPKNPTPIPSDPGVDTPADRPKVNWPAIIFLAAAALAAFLILPRILG